LKLERPKNMTKIYSFLELAGYYQRFIEWFSTIAIPMTRLTQEEIKWEWTKECKESFQELKKGLTTVPVINFPLWTKGLVVYSDDASKKGLGYVLMQYSKVIVYASIQLQAHKINYPVYDLELVAIVFVLRVWRHYLYGFHVKIFMDHKSLRYLMTQKELNMWQRRWMKLIKDYDCIIDYHLGRAILS
jgi:hypothetical protein